MSFESEQRTCKPMAVLFQCMTKFTTNKKKKKKESEQRAFIREDSEHRHWRYQFPNKCLSCLSKLLTSSYI